MLGSHILYLKGIRRMMFQLSGFYYMGSIIGDNIGATTGIPSSLLSTRGLLLPAV